MAPRDGLDRTSQSAAVNELHDWEFATHRTIRAQRQSDEWTVTIDDAESYRIPVAVIEGG
jgi:hypothetical protein